jgi:hypothetical protein
MVELSNATHAKIVTRLTLKDRCADKLGTDWTDRHIDDLLLKIFESSWIHLIYIQTYLNQLCANMKMISQLLYHTTLVVIILTTHTDKRHYLLQLRLNICTQL